MHPGPSVTPYEMLGGEPAVRALVERFYDLMDETPEYYVIRKLHPENLTGSRDKLFMFLSGWLGGPPLYTDQYGHSMLRARHLPFSIGLAERDAWMACMNQALHALVEDEKLRTWLAEQLFKTADWMRNRQD
ncbi:MAG: group II truncated hemoglobin [Betaproteobacteria bacterium]|nr:group II truncated hemoglobin [Betaproteobacteria bacterium]